MWIKLVRTFCCALRYRFRSDKAPMPAISLLSIVRMASRSVLAAVRKCFSRIKTSSFSGVPLTSSLCIQNAFSRLVEYKIPNPGNIELCSYHLLANRYLLSTYIKSNILIISLYCWLRNHNCIKSARFDSKDCLHCFNWFFISQTRSCESDSLWKEYSYSMMHSTS